MSTQGQLYLSRLVLYVVGCLGRASGNNEELGPERGNGWGTFVKRKSIRLQRICTVYMCFSSRWNNNEASDTWGWEGRCLDVYTIDILYVKISKVNQDIRSFVLLALAPGYSTGLPLLFRRNGFRKVVATIFATSSKTRKAKPMVHC